MKLETYDLISEKSLVIYEFVSEGPKGRIIKFVQYLEIPHYPNVYNLGLGDKDQITGLLDFSVVTNNSDTKKVLSTVAYTLYLFTDKYPDKKIFVEGSTKSRTRLYRMGIVNNFVEIMKDFEVYGLNNDVWERFNSNTDYQAFLIVRK